MRTLTKHSYFISVRLVLIAFLLFGGLLQAQPEMPTRKDALKLMEYQRYTEALGILEQLLALEPEATDLWYYIGTANLYGVSSATALGYLTHAEELLKKETDPNTLTATEDLYHEIGKAYHQNYQFDKAIEYYKKYMKNLTREDQMLFVVQREIKEAQNGITIMSKKNNFYARNIGTPVNTHQSEHSPVISSDRKLLLFTSRDEKSRDELQFELSANEDGEGSVSAGKRKQKYLPEVIYQSFMQPDGTWSKPNKIGASTSDQCVQLFDNDKKLLIYRYDNKGGGLYVSERKSDTAWAEPMPMKGINSVSYQGHGTITADGKRIIFSTETKESGRDDLDLYVSEKDEKGKWSKPTRLPSTINTPYDEDSPYLLANGNSLYFSSLGHNTMGGFDVFKTTYDAKRKKWSKPENLGYPINTPKDDLYFTFDTAGAVGFISSNRDGVVGSNDLYMIGIKMNVNVKGKLQLEAQEGNVQVLSNTRLKFSNFETKETVETTTDSNGGYKVVLVANQVYIVTINPGTGEEVEQSISLPPAKQVGDNFTRDIVLKKE